MKYSTATQHRDCNSVSTVGYIFGWFFNEKLFETGADNREGQKKTKQSTR
jgi:hypothetical protein